MQRLGAQTSEGDRLASGIKRVTEIYWWVYAVYKTVKPWTDSRMSQVWGEKIWAYVTVQASAPKTDNLARILKREIRVHVAEMGESLPLSFWEWDDITAQVWSQALWFPDINPGREQGMEYVSTNSSLMETHFPRWENLTFGSLLEFCGISIGTCQYLWEGKGNCRWCALSSSGILLLHSYRGTRTFRASDDWYGSSTKGLSQSSLQSFLPL